MFESGVHFLCVQSLFAAALEPFSNSRVQTTNVAAFVAPAAGPDWIVLGQWMLFVRDVLLNKRLELCKVVYSTLTDQIMRYYWLDRNKMV